MRQFYSLVGALALSSVAFGQLNVPTQYSATQVAKNAPENVNTATIANAGSRAVIFEETFESGTFPPVGWTETSGPTSTITVPAEQAWHDVAGNSGQGAGIVFNNSVDVHDEWLITPMISIPNNPAIRFQYDWNTSQYWHVTPNDNVDIVALISTTGGTVADFANADTLAWEQDPVTVQEWQTFVWYTYQTDVTAYAGQDVWIAFHYLGQDGAQYTMDNVRIADVEANDLVLNQVFDADINVDFQHRTMSYEQVREFAFTALVSNNGAVAQPNVVIEYDILDGSGASVASGVSANSIASLPVNETDTIILNQIGYTPPTSDETYSIVLNVASDSTQAVILSDDTLTRLINVQEFQWGRETGIVDGSFVNVAGANGAGVQIGPTFLSTGTTVTRGLSIGIGANSPTGQIVFGALYLFDGTDYVPVKVTAEHTITNADLGTLITLEWEDELPVTINPGDQLLATAAHFGGPDADQPQFATAGNTLQGTILGFDGSGAIFQLIDPPVPVVRINSDPTVSVEENENVTFLLGQNVPNPANANSIINYTMNQAGNVNFEIIDYTGRVVLNRAEGTRAIGDHTIEVDASKLAAGIYTYTLTVDGNRVSKQMVVTK